MVKIKYEAENVFDDKWPAVSEQSDQSWQRRIWLYMLVALQIDLILTNHLPGT